MMGRTHALSGSVLYLAIAAAPGQMLLPTGGTGLVFGAVMAGGAAMLPDLDHPQASIARSLGPITGVSARLVAAVSGGHRQGTHSLLGLGVFAVLTAALALHPVLIAAWAAFLLGLALGAIGGEGRRTRAIASSGSVVVGGGLTMLAVVDPPPAAAVVAAVVVGVAAHILGDMLTQEGCPLLWPHQRRHRLAALTTDGIVERWVVGPLLALALLQLATMMSPPTDVLVDYVGDRLGQMGALLTEVLQ